MNTAATMVRKSVISRLRLVVLICVGSGLLGASSIAGAAVNANDDLEEILHGLEQGMVALKRLERPDALEMLQRIANEVRRERGGERERGGDNERRIAINQLETMQMALAALREGERRDAADLLHLAIRVREMALEGRRDEEARRMRERSPGRESIIKLLHLAAEIYSEFEMHDRAEKLVHLTRELWPPREGERRERPARERDRPRERRGDGERERAAHELEIMRSAMPALLEAGRRDTAELLEHAIHARELALEGRRGEEAAHVRETAPNLGQQIEILMYAANLWDEFGHEKQAATVRQLAEEMHGRFRREREGGEREGREREVREREGREREGREREGGEREGREREGREREHARDSDARHERDGDERFQHAMERIERLEQHIERLAHGIERLQQELHERGRER